MGLHFDNNYFNAITNTRIRSIVIDKLLIFPSVARSSFEFPVQIPSVCHNLIFFFRLFVFIFNYDNRIPRNEAKPVVISLGFVIMSFHCFFFPVLPLHFIYAIRSFIAYLTTQSDSETNKFESMFSVQPSAFRLTNEL